MVMTRFLRTEWDIRKLLTFKFELYEVSEFFSRCKKCMPKNFLIAIHISAKYEPCTTLRQYR